MKTTCLLVKLSDGRKFFTAKTAKPQLIEFAKTFKAKLEIVEACDPEILSLKDLATFICDQTVKCKPTSYINLQKEISPEIRNYYNNYTSFSKLSSRQQLMEKVASIRSYILSQFNTGKTVKIKNITKKFKKHNISTSAIYRHVNHVKNMLESSNKTVTKIAPGVYKMN